MVFLQVSNLINLFNIFIPPIYGNKPLGGLQVNVILEIYVFYFLFSF